jgi:hypothetical protein
MSTNDGEAGHVDRLSSKGATIASESVPVTTSRGVVA